MASIILKCQHLTLTKNWA